MIIEYKKNIYELVDIFVKKILMDLTPNLITK